MGSDEAEFLLGYMNLQQKDLQHQKENVSNNG